MSACARACVCLCACVHLCVCVRVRVRMSVGRCARCARVCLSVGVRGGARIYASKYHGCEMLMCTTDFLQLFLLFTSYTTFL